MSQCPEFTHLLALPRLRVQNANAISSPLTHGFPAMTAFLGLMWALERKTYAAGLKFMLLFASNMNLTARKAHYRSGKWSKTSYPSQILTRSVTKQY